MSRFFIDSGFTSGEPDMVSDPKRGAGRRKAAAEIVRLPGGGRDGILAGDDPSGGCGSVR